MSLLFWKGKCVKMKLVNILKENKKFEEGLIEDIKKYKRENYGIVDNLLAKSDSILEKIYEIYDSGRIGSAAVILATVMGNIAAIYGGIIGLSKLYEHYNLFLHNKNELVFPLSISLLFSSSFIFAKYYNNYKNKVKRLRKEIGEKLIAREKWMNKELENYGSKVTLSPTPLPSQRTELDIPLFHFDKNIIPIKKLTKRGGLEKSLFQFNPSLEIQEVYGGEWRLDDIGLVINVEGYSIGKRKKHLISIYNKKEIISTRGVSGSGGCMVSHIANEITLDLGIEKLKEKYLSFYKLLKQGPIIEVDKNNYEEAAELIEKMRKIK